MLALIIDDEKKSRELLHGLVVEYCPEIKSIMEAGDIKSAVQQMRTKMPDLVFLDIEMPEENGFNLFNYFPSFSFEVIFITAYDKHALKAFEYAAIDYILKPINVDRLMRSVSRVVANRIQKTQQNPPTILNRLAIPTLQGFKIIGLHEVIYCRAERNYTLVILEGGEKEMVSKNLGKFEALLDEQQFVRVHRSFIVNINKVRQFIKGKNPLIELSDGSQLEVSANRREALLQRLKIID